MGKLLFFVLLVFSPFIWSQDQLFYKDGRKEEVKVVEINKTEVKYKKLTNLDGPNFVCLKSELLSINYENGTVENFVEELNNLNDTELLKYAAMKDAWRYYREYKKGMGLTLLSCVFLTPIGGAIVASKFANQEIDVEKRPKVIKRRGANGTEIVDNPYYNNTIYKEQYKEQAKKIQKIKTWKAFGGGTFIAAGVGGIIAITIIKINDFNSW